MECWTLKTVQLLWRALRLWVNIFVKDNDNGNSYYNLADANYTEETIRSHVAYKTNTTYVLQRSDLAAGNFSSEQISNHYCFMHSIFVFSIFKSCFFTQWNLRVKSVLFHDVAVQWSHRVKWQWNLHFYVLQISRFAFSFRVILMVRLFQVLHFPSPHPSAYLCSYMYRTSLNWKTVRDQWYLSVAPIQKKLCCKKTGDVDHLKRVLLACWHIR